MAVDLEGLRKALGDARRLLVVLHDNPDPDALASGCAMAKLVEATAGIQTRIACEGIVGRAENRAVTRELRLRLMPASRVNWSKWPVVAMLDTQPRAGNNSFPRKLTPQIVIDHHPARRDVKAKYVDIRPEYGSCTTMLYEYLMAAEVTIAPRLAAAMCYAISSDTQDLVRQAGTQDTEAYVKLYPIADKRSLGRILHPRVRHGYYSTLARAILSAFTYGHVIGSHLGEVEHPDWVSLSADLLLQHERMSWCLVTGTHDDDLFISLRGLPGRAHAGTTLRRVLGKMGAAGGHGTAAGGRVSVAGKNLAEREELQKEIVMRLVHLLFRRDDVILRPLIGPAELNEAFYKFV